MSLRKNTTTVQESSAAKLANLAELETSKSAGMSQTERDILTKHLLTLCHDLVIDEVLVALQSKRILQKIDVETIMAVSFTYSMGPLVSFGSEVE